MQSFHYKGPNGPFTVNAETQDEADQLLWSHAVPDQEREAAAAGRNPSMVGQQSPPIPQPPLPPQPPTPKPYYNTEGLGAVRRGLAGVTGGARDAYLGVKDFVGQSTPEERHERKDWAKHKSEFGTAGAIGDFIGSAGMTAPLEALTGGTGAVLTKTVPLLKTLSRFGGRTTNLGQVVRNAAEGGISAGVVGDANDETYSDRAKSAAKGAAFGTVLPAAGMGVNAVTGTGKAIWRAGAPTAAQAERRAYDAFGRELNKGSPTGVQDLMQDLVTARPSVLPRTTAAMSGDPGLAALERGARQRRFADFESHDEDVGRAAWNEFTSTSPQHQTAAGDDLIDKFYKNGIPTTPKVVGGADPAKQRPFLQDLPLRQATARLANGMSSSEVDMARNLASELGNFERAATGKGSSVPDLGTTSRALSGGLAIMSAASSSPFLWKLRSAYNTLTFGSVDKTSKVIDEALLDPAKFTDLVTRMQAKINKGESLTVGEWALKQTILAASRAGTTTPQEK